MGLCSEDIVSFFLHWNHSPTREKSICPAWEERASTAVIQKSLQPLGEPEVGWNVPSPSSGGSAELFVTELLHLVATGEMRNSSSALPWVCLWCVTRRNGSWCSSVILSQPVPTSQALSFSFPLAQLTLASSPWNDEQGRAKTSDGYGLRGPKHRNGWNEIFCGGSGHKEWECVAGGAEGPGSDHRLWYLSLIFSVLWKDWGRHQPNQECPWEQGSFQCWRSWISCLGEQVSCSGFLSLGIFTVELM